MYQPLDKLFLFVLFLFSASLWAQSSCKQSISNTQRGCASAMSDAGVGSSVGGGGDSIGLASAIESLQSQTQIANYSSALNTCQNLEKACEQSCGGSPSSGGSGPGTGSGEGMPGTGDSPPCSKSQQSEDSNGFVAALPGQNCTATPLILQLPSPGHPVTPILLTSQLEGLFFDILGLNSLPTAHTKKQISWLRPESRDSNYFLVLPSVNGSVTGIDEMFGDNTALPGGGFAANGFLALARFDGLRADGSVDLLARDHLIDAKDEVFSKLRLWSDRNGDGIAQPEELFTLSQLSVISIDLNYNADFPETDAFGNSTKLKSAVVTTNGLYLIYDVWFKLKL